MAKVQWISSNIMKKKFLIFFVLNVFNVIYASQLEKNEYEDDPLIGPPLPKWAVKLVNSWTGLPFNKEEANQFALDHGYENLGQIGALEGYFLFKDDRQLNKYSPHQIIRRSPSEIDQDLSNLKEVEWFELQIPQQRGKRSIVDIQDPLYKKQWHLVNIKTNFFLSSRKICVYQSNTRCKYQEYMYI